MKEIKDKEGGGGGEQERRWEVSGALARFFSSHHAPGAERTLSPVAVGAVGALGPL